MGFILTVSATKDLLEDLKRHREDEKENFKAITVGQVATKVIKFEKIPSRFIRVGNVVKIHKNESIPCDMVLLKSSHKDGLVFIETKNLDGETSLKQKNVAVKLR